MRIDYDEIRRIHRLEKNAPQLVDVDEDFFESVTGFFRAEKKRLMQNPDAWTEAQSREFTNLRKMIAEIVSMREKKLLNKALEISRTGDGAPLRLAEPEKRALSELVATLSAYARLGTALSDSPALGAQSKGDYNSVAVRIIKDVPAFVGADQASYGPFSRNAVIDLPRTVADVLFKRKLAETV